MHGRKDIILNTVAQSLSISLLNCSEVIIIITSTSLHLRFICFIFERMSVLGAVSLFK